MIGTLKSLWQSVIRYGILSIEETIRFKGDDAMRKLEYTFKTDTLFKMLFVQYPELLKISAAGSQAPYAAVG